MTSAEREAKRRQRKIAAGLAKLEIWAPKPDHDDIRAYAKARTEASLTQSGTEKEPTS